MLTAEQNRYKFTLDLSDATEAWFDYADKTFGPCDVEIDAGLWDARYAGKKMFIRTDIETYRRSLDAWDAHTHAFLTARGHVYDYEKRTW